MITVLGLVAYRVSQNKPSESKQSNNSQANNRKSNPAMASKITCPVSSGTVEVPRESAVGAFTSPITNIDTIAVISPGKFVGDSRFTYLQIKNQQRTPVFAPADGTLIKISYKTRIDLSPGLSSMPDYDLTFLVDCHTMYRVNHITNPNPEIAALRPNAEPLQLGKGLPAPSDADTQPKTNIMVKAGQQIGTTTGTPNAHNWDFGVFIDQASTCPYKQFNEPPQSAWLALLGDAIKDPTKPIPGTTCDVNGNF